MMARQENADERVVDRELVQELASGAISQDAILEALEGFPETRARGVLEWAARTGEPEKALAAWGRKHGSERKRVRKRESAANRGRQAALIGALRVTFRKQLAAEELVARREAALAGGLGAYDAEVRGRLDAARRKDILFDAERIEVETLSLRVSCAKEYPHETLERKMGLDPEAEREFERRVSGLRGGLDGEADARWIERLSPDDRLRVEVYELAALALADELREQASFLEGRLQESGYDRKRIRETVKGLPYEPREYDR